MTPTIVLAAGTIVVVVFLLLCWVLFGGDGCDKCGRQDHDDDLYW